MLLAVVLCAFATRGCTRTERISGPLPQEIYVWQRVWNEQVEAALLTARDAAAGFAVLAAEVNVPERGPQIAPHNINFAALKTSGRPIALAIRVDPFAGPFR